MVWIRMERLARVGCGEWGLRLVNGFGVWGKGRVARLVGVFRQEVYDLKVLVERERERE